MTKFKGRRMRRRGNTSASSSSSSSSVSNLPMDLITDILSRLPVKSLSRFRCTSKSLNSLIHSPNFINLYFRFSKLNPNPIFSSILSLDQITTYQYIFRFNLIDALDRPIDLDLPYMHARVCRLLSISNGLICVTLSDEYSCDIIVSNPATGNFRKIPPFNPTSWGDDDVAFYGFNSNVDGFELFRIDCSSSTVKVNSFSSSANIWEDVKVNTKLLHSFSYGWPPVFKDGVFYWEGHHYAVGYVLMFDLFHKVLDEILVPCGAGFKLIEFKEQVVVIDLVARENSVWTLNENDKTWKMIKSFRVSDYIPGYGFGIGFVTALGCTGNGKLVLKHYDHSFSKLYLYDMDTDDINSLSYLNVEGGYGMYLFTESLIAVETGDFGNEV